MNGLLLAEVGLRGVYSAHLSVYGIPEPTKPGELRLPGELHLNLDILVRIRLALILEAELGTDCYMKRESGRFCESSIYTRADAPNSDLVKCMQPTRRC